MIFVRIIDSSSAFKRDFKKHSNIDAKLGEILEILKGDGIVPEKYQAHKLIGDWKGYHECHVKPDLLLIYKKSDDNKLQLARLGTHSELF